MLSGHHGLSLGAEPSAAFGGKVLNQFWNTEASTALMFGPLLFWKHKGLRRFGARGLPRFCTTGVSATMEHEPRRHARASAALETPRPPPLWGTASAAWRLPGLSPCWPRARATLGSPGPPTFGETPASAALELGRHCFGNTGTFALCGMEVWGMGVCHMGITKASAALAQVYAPLSEHDVLRCFGSRAFAALGAPQPPWLCIRVPLLFRNTEAVASFGRRAPVSLHRGFASFGKGLCRSRVEQRGRRRCGVAASAALGTLGPAAFWARPSTIWGTPGPSLLLDVGLHCPGAQATAGPGAPGRATLWGKGLCRFVGTRVRNNLGVGPSTISGTHGLHYFGAGASAPWDISGPASLWAKGLRLFGNIGAYGVVR